jgi:HEAT repeat protein
MKRNRILLAVLLIAVACVMVWQVWKGQLLLGREPVYKGRTVDSWLDDLTVSNGVTRNARSSEWAAALRQIGPEAVPFIFRKLRQNDSPWRNKYREIWPNLPGFLHKLLPQPKPMAFNSSWAGRALAECGTNATRIVIDNLNDGNPAVREAAWRAVSMFFARQSISTNQTISLCLPALKDDVAMVRLEAAMCLGRIGAAASNTVPALLPILSSSEAGRRASEQVFVRSAAARAIGEIGPAASYAIPALTNLMATGKSYDRVSAAIALWRITSNESLALPVIMKELPSFDKNSKHIPINGLKAMGPRAKAAFPLLVSELNDTQDAYLRGVITNAMKAIDPEAAAKAGME